MVISDSVASPRRLQPLQLALRLLSVLLMCGLSTSALAVGTGDRAPAWTGIDISSRAEISFPAVLQGKPAVVIFWATWCPYCKAFMPYVKQIEADYRDRGIKIITLNTKERGRGDPAAYVENLNFPFIAIENADAIGDAYDIPFIPGLLVVDGNGDVVYRRKSTDLPAGRTVSQQWALEVRQILDQLID